jgi:hypothetical protein
MRIRIRDPVPFWPLGPGSGMSKKSRSGSGMNIRELRNNLLVKIFKFFDAYADTDQGSGNLLDPGSGIRAEKVWIQDPG